jgi:hypothetical protein
MGEEAVQAFAPHLLEVLDHTIRRTLTEEEAVHLIELLARIAASADELRERPNPG